MILNILRDTLLKGTESISNLITKVIISKKASKEIGLEKAMKVSGYYDEPLVGKRNGQRPIRLNRSFRAIYKIKVINFVEIIEVNKHDY